MIIFGSVDGTYPSWDDDEYKRVFRYSTVHNLYMNWVWGAAKYFRGPTTFDGKATDATSLSAWRIYYHVMKYWKAGETGVFLAGYSRGGAAVIEVAKWLQEKSVPVDCLILYDPVDRTPGVGLPWRDTPIAKSVKQVIYAKRSPAAASRESFGNCGLYMENGSRTPYKEFFGTHGGIGGVPWGEPKDGGYINEGFPDYKTNVTVAMDESCAREVQGWSYGLIDSAISDCLARLSKPAAPETPKPYVPVPPPIPPERQKKYVVQPGDWLSKIAIKFYGDMNKWPTIYNYPQNKIIIGPNPDIIKPGQELVIP